MPIELSANETRVIGCLMEKSVVTPDQYPMTLNALTNACNQKSSRDPVMSLESGTVLATLRSLEAKHLVRTEENFKSQVEKFTHRLCNTPFSDYQFDPPQFAIICVLLLRGKRTPGELRANSGRLYTFADNNEVNEALNTLIDREGGAVVARVGRTPGRRDDEYMHLLSGELPEAAPQHAARPTPTHLEGESDRTSPAIALTPTSPDTADLEARIAKLEEEVAGLKRLLE
jgi:uncharacterized protein YceH (UPF0502 family)